MTEQNNSTPASPTAQVKIALSQGQPQLNGWQPELACPFGAIDTMGRELQASAIADDIAALNFRSWNPFNENDLDEVFTLLVAEPEHRNNGTLAGRSANDLANTLRSGGWIFEGYLGVSVKPDSPRKSAEGKVIKYESPRGAGNQQLFVPRVSVFE